MSWTRWEIWRTAYLACLAAAMCVAAGWLCWRTWQDAAALAAARYALDGGTAAPGRAMARRGDVPPACTSACDVE